MSKTIMQQSLVKVLSSMTISEESKVLISLSLITDDQIGEFLYWLKANIAEDNMKPMEEEICGKAVEISKGI